MRSPRFSSFLVWLSMFASVATAQEPFTVAFEDVSRQAFGGLRIGISYGAGAWGDFDGDGDPDLWLGNHFERPTLWQNNGDGTFTDRTAFLLPQAVRDDTHAGTWADFDDDGDLDLLELAGAQYGMGVGPNRLWLNRYPQPFVDVAPLVGLDFPEGRGRSAQWLDWNRDGLLDVAIANFESAQSRDVVFTQTPLGNFRPEVGGSIGFRPSRENTRFVVLGDFDSDGQHELLFQGGTIFPTSAWEVDPEGWTEMDFAGGQTVTSVQDIVLADLDNDLDLDFYLTRDPYWKTSELGIAVGGWLKASIEVDGYKRVRFHCEGDLKIDLPAASVPEQVFLGASRVQATQLPLLVSAGDKRLAGTHPGEAGAQNAFYLGRESDSNIYELVITTTQREAVPFSVRGTTPVTLVEGEVIDPVVRPDVVIISAEPDPVTHIPAESTQGRGVVSGDFDNDGDVDLYVVRTGAAINRQNVLYQNLGNGQFDAVPLAAGAGGPGLGVGDNASVVDFDQDGFLDLLVANGWGPASVAGDGPVNLFRNTGGNGNHWLQIDLQGTRGARDAIGSIVYLTTTQGTQRRDQTGGMHRSTQNHSRLHFGLGAADKVEKIEVHWPDGSVQVLRDLPVDQILRIEQR